MASIKLDLRKNKKSFSIVVKIYHKRDSRYIATGYSILKQGQFINIDNKQSVIRQNKKNGEYVVSNQFDTTSIDRINKHLQFMVDKYRERLHLISKSTDIEKFNVSDLLNKISNNHLYSFSGIIQDKIKELKELNKYNTAKNYQTALSFWYKYFEKDEKAGETIYFNDINLRILEKARIFYLKNGNINGFWGIAKNTRATFNYAIKHHLIDKSENPFDEFKFKTEKTRKRALTRSQIEKLVNYRGNDFENQVLDIFKISFFTVGTSIREICLLKVKNINHGFLEYKRGKSKDLFSWEIQDAIKPIINKLIEKKEQDEYLLNEINEMNSQQEIERKISVINASMNRTLKKICNKLEIPEITTYTARRSWANLAREIGIELSVISEALGHEDLKTTQIYLNEIDTKTVNSANKKVGDLFN